MSPQTAASTSLHAEALLVSLNGGIVFAIAILMSSVAIASGTQGMAGLTQAVLFGLLSIGAWAYLVDGITEKIVYEKDSLVRKSLLAGTTSASLANAERVVLKYEGLNLISGVESITVFYRDKKTSRIALGPCWRRRDIDAFLQAVVQADPSRDVLITKE
ncbi:MAG: hypothetical protein WC477_04915 [Patescibacteria group bacterium]